MTLRTALFALLAITLSEAAVAPAWAAISPDQKGVTWHWQSWQRKDGTIKWTGVRADLQAMRGAGISWARVHIGPDMSDALTRQLIEMAAAENVHFVALVAGTDAEAAQEPPEYLAHLARTWAGSVNVWEIGNEENNSQFWSLKGGRAAQVGRYVRYLEASYRAIKKAAPNATILMGGLMAYNLEAYLPDFIRFGGGQYTDGFAIHPYAADPARVVERLTAIEREIAPDKSLRGKPVWITEIGFFANEPLWRNAGGVDDEATKARYLTETMHLLREHGITTPIFWYDLHEAKPDVCGYSLVLFHSEGTLSALPAYTAYRDLSPAGHGPSIPGWSADAPLCR